MLSRPWQFILQGGLIALCAAFGSTLAASLFLANVGSAAIPLYYILFATLSVPLSMLFSAVIDRWPRCATLTLVMLAYMASAPLLALLAPASTGLTYGLYIVVSACELLIYSLYYILFGDYFTVAEAKRYGGAMTIALGIGAMTGSLLVSVLTVWMAPHRAMLALPVLVAVSLWHLWWLSRRHRPLDEPEQAAEEGLVDSLKALPRLSRRTPIVLIMAAAMFINVVGQCVMEFEAFSIYGQHYSDEAALAGFLGKMTAIVDVIGILIVFFVSDPLIPRLGVARMTLLPPALNIASFLILASSSGLPAGILAHLNYYPLEHSLNVPVFALTYNAVPHRFVGRVRVINDGIIYPLALVAAGILLALLAPALGLRQLALVGLAGALLYGVVQRALGRQYLRGLIDMLKSGAIEFDQVGAGFKLPDAYRDDIRAMLADPDAAVMAMGVELATFSGVALSVDDYVQVLPRLPTAIARAALDALYRADPPAAHRILRQLLGSRPPLVRARALEALGRRGFRLDAGDLATLQQDDDEVVRVIAAVIVAMTATSSPAAAPPATGAGETARLAALYVLSAFPGQVPGRLLTQLASGGSDTLRAEALSTAHDSGSPTDPLLLRWGEAAAADRSAAVRAMALQLLVRLSPDEALGALCRRAFADPEPVVRRTVALALGRRGAAALALLSAQLATAELAVVQDVIEGIGAAGAETADPMLFAYLTSAVYPVVTANLTRAALLPLDRPGWQPLALALADSTDRALRTVLHALTVLGYKRVLGLVRTAMQAGDARVRANAVETLASLAHRHYVLPLLPFLEAAPGGVSAPRPPPPEAMQASLRALWRDPDPFVAAAAAGVWYQEFATVPDVPDASGPALLQETVRRLACAPLTPRAIEDLPMNRLVFLKSVPLFAEMSLADLMAVDRAMGQESYLPDETIVREGDIGDKLYIVLSGDVAIRKKTPQGDKELARLQIGQLFGEMALFGDERRSATVVATSDARLLSLDRDRFHSLASQRPEIPLQLCKVLATRLRSAIS